MQKPTRKKSLFDSNDPILKPQNRFSDDLKTKISTTLTEWLVSHDYDNYHARLFSYYLCQEAISKRIAETASSSAQVLFSDKEKAEQIVFEGKKIAQQLEREKKLDSTLEYLEKLDAQREGNSL